MILYDRVKIGIPHILAEAATKKLAEKIDDKLAVYEGKQSERRKTNRKKTSEKYAIKLGFHPIVGQIDLLKNIITEQIRNEVRRTRIRHIDLSGMTGIKRPNITKILNFHLENVSIDLLVAVASALQISITMSLTKKI